MILKSQNAPNFLGSAPDPAGGAYSAPPDPLASAEGFAAPLAMNSSPNHGPSGLTLSIPTFYSTVPPMATVLQGELCG